jgi:hypothetical protein
MIRPHARVTFFPPGRSYLPNTNRSHRRGYIWRFADTHTGPTSNAMSLAPKLLQVVAHSSKSAFKASSSPGSQFQVLQVTCMLLRLYLRSKTPPFLFSPLHIPTIYSQSRASFFVTSLKQVFAAQHRLVNEQLSALAQRIHGFTVETVKPSK